MIVEVTQFKLPDGRKVLQTVNVSDDCQEGYKEMLESSCRLTSEILMDGHVSLCIESKEEDYAIEIVENGPEVIETIENMLKNFTIQKYEKWVNEQMMED